ncbi:hypothetical protein EBU58_08105 [bacterium]|nr:hypothetical protein [bacterium]
MTSSLPQHGSQASVLSIEQSLRAAVPEAIFASSHVVRRIILADLDLPLLRTRMPHGESIVLSPTRLLELADDVWALPAETPSLLLLVARPDPEAHHQNMDGLLRAYWRLLTHGCIDLKARELLATSQDVSRRIAELPQLGNLQLAEARSVLTKEARLRDPSDSREVFAEFIATALELASSPAREVLTLSSVIVPLALASR